MDRRSLLQVGRCKTILLTGSMVGLLFCNSIAVAQNAQSGTLQQGIAQTPVNPVGGQGRVVPAPWRPSFGTIARQNSATQTNPNQGFGTIPNRQPIVGSNGLAPPNSPYNQPTAINLQTGTSTPIGTVNNNSGLPATTTIRNLQLPSTLPPVGNSQPTTNQPANQPSPFVAPVFAPENKGSITRVTKSMTQLPNDAGQVWREYDITPYTSQTTGIPDPQQAILDWILRETGTEMWFGQPLGILNADKNQLRVYHTPEIQNIVHKIVDRFVNTRGQVQNLEVSLVTIGKPNWRSTAYPVLQPIEVQSPGVEAWMISKENAALLRSSLARRADFKDHGTGQIAHNDGQAVVLRNTRPVQFIRNFRWTANQFPPYQPLVTTVDEGYTMEISSLTSLDGNTIEASIECHVDQVERLNTVKVEVPGAVGATTDKISLQIPQLVSWRLKERFRWPNDQVLLLSCGVVASPGPQASRPSNLPGFLGGNRQRADALLFVDYRGPNVPNGPVSSTAQSRTVPVTPKR